MRVRRNWTQSLSKATSFISGASGNVILGVFLLILAISSLSYVSQAHAMDATPINSGITDKCLDVQGGKAYARNAVQLYTCNGTVAQQWEQLGDGTIRNQGLCLDVQWGNKAPKTPVWLYDCNGSSAQQWKVAGDGSLVSLQSNLCLDDQYGGTNDRNPIWTYDCNTTSSQKWTPPVPAPVAPPAPVVVAPTSAPAAAPAQAPTRDGYTNTDGNHVNSPSSNPAGATAQCVDGTYSYSQHHSGTCSHHGGVASWL